MGFRRTLTFQLICLVSEATYTIDMLLGKFKMYLSAGIKKRDGL